MLPKVELRAVQMFVGWERETGLTAAVRENVSELDELDAARRAGRLWVATSRENNEVIAFAQAEVLDGMAHLDEINVLPEHARRGVGSALVETVCAWAVEAEYTHITLSTFRDVPWNRPFYERRGFRVMETGELGPQHAALVEAERARGLRTDLRVMMSRTLLFPTRNS